jgi:hypothetical protein
MVGKTAQGADRQAIVVGPRNLQVRKPRKAVPIQVMELATYLSSIHD